MSIRPYCQGTSLVTLFPNSGAAQNTSAVANFNALDAVSSYRGYGYAPRVKVPETVYNPPRTLISGLTNAVDAIGLPRGCAYEGMLVLETSKDLSAQPPEPGRLLYFVDGESVVVADDIHSPVALAYAASRTIYISARNPGRILTIAFNSAWEERGYGQYR